MVQQAGPERPWPLGVHGLRGCYQLKQAVAAARPQLSRFSYKDLTATYLGNERRRLLLGGPHSCEVQLSGLHRVTPGSAATTYSMHNILACRQLRPSPCRSAAPHTFVDWQRRQVLRCFPMPFPEVRTFVPQTCNEAGTSKAPVRSSGGPPTVCSRMLLAVRSECSSPCSEY